MNDLHITYTYSNTLPTLYQYSHNHIMINMKLWGLVVKEGLLHAMQQALDNKPSERLTEAVMAYGEALKEEKNVTVVFTVE